MRIVFTDSSVPRHGRNVANIAPILRYAYPLI
jgi:hypothetical protein